jgi:hypothetical protein
MSDSVLVVVGGEAAAGVAELLVVPDRCGEGEQSLCDADEDAGERAAAVALERQLA